MWTEKIDFQSQLCSAADRGRAMRQRECNGTSEYSTVPSSPSCRCAAGWWQWRPSPRLLLVYKSMFGDNSSGRFLAMKWSTPPMSLFHALPRTAELVSRQVYCACPQRWWYFNNCCLVCSPLLCPIYRKGRLFTCALKHFSCTNT